MKDKLKKKKTVKPKISNKLLLLLIFIATIFMSVGYASINSIVLNLGGNANYAADKTLHISVATSAHSNSTINSFSGTMLNSTVNLTNNATETFTITIFNNTTDDYVFDQVLRDTEQSLFYSNQNITFSLSGLNHGDNLLHGQSVTFTVTFSFVNNFTPSSSSDYILDSYINFKFRKPYTVTYNNITTQQSYPTIVLENTNLEVSFSSDVPYKVKVTMGTTVLTENTDYTYVTDPNNSSNKLLTVTNVTNNITIDRYYHITYNLYGGTNNPGNLDLYVHGESVTLLDPTYVDKIFDGWYDNSSYTNPRITTINPITSNVTLHAKWIDIYQNAATYIVGLVGNASDTSTNVITLTAPTGATCTKTLAYDGTSDKNLRFVGADPCNYVKFNCDSSGNNCETWRIMGVMKGVDSNPVLKLVKNDNTMSARWHSKNDNTWVGSELYTTLNNTYINSFNSGVIADYVLSAQWRIGAVNYNSPVATAYTAEKSSTSAAAYIGIITASDYFYATSGTNDSTRTTCLTTNMYSVTDVCYQNNYLMITANNTRQNQWTMSKANQGKNIIYISNAGKAVRGSYSSAYYYRPVLYLKSDVKINVITGTGTSTDPYLLAKGS